MFASGPTREYGYVTRWGTPMWWGTPMFENKTALVWWSHVCCEVSSLSSIALLRDLEF